jgi:hypothetical protein
MGYELTYSGRFSILCSEWNRLRWPRLVLLGDWVCCRIEHALRLPRIRLVLSQSVWLGSCLPGAGISSPEILLPDCVRRANRRLLIQQ